MVALVISVCNLIVRTESSGNPPEIQRSPIETNQRPVTVCRKAKINFCFANAYRSARALIELFRLANRPQAGLLPIAIWEQSQAQSLIVYRGGSERHALV